MKKQFTVDEIGILKNDCMPLGRHILEQLLAEHERLKRLHDNLQAQIKDLEAWLAEEESQVTRYEIEETIILLKGLYDEH